MNEYIQDEIDSFDNVYFDVKKGNYRVIAGSRQTYSGIQYEVMSCVDFGESSPISWTIAYPEGVIEMIDYLKTDVAYMNVR